MGQIVIDALQQSRAFAVAGTASVDLVSLTLKRGSADDGGGILNYGTLTVMNSTLSGNSADLGGGIYDDDGSLHVKNPIMWLNVSSIGPSIAGSLSSHSDFNLIDALRVINHLFVGHAMDSFGDPVNAPLARHLPQRRLGRLPRTPHRNGASYVIWEKSGVAERELHAVHF